MIKTATLYVKNYLIVTVILVIAVACDTADAPEEAPAVENTAAPTSTLPPPSATAAPSATATPASTQTAVPIDTPAPEPTSAGAVIEDTIIEDVLYVEAVHPDAQDQLMDIYVPGSPGSYPVVIWAHGSNQDKTTGRSLGRILSGLGFVVMSIDWRDDVTEEHPQYQLREAFENADCALRMAAARGAEYGADPEQVIWGGFSAGGWLGSMVSFSRDDLIHIIEDLDLEDGNPPQQANCAAEVDPAPITAYVGSGVNFPSEIWLESPEEGEAGGETAFLRQFVAIGQNPELRVRIILGNFDRGAPLENGEAFLAALQEAGYDAALFPQVGGHLPYYDVVIEQILALVEE